MYPEGDLFVWRKDKVGGSSIRAVIICMAVHEWCECTLYKQCENGKWRESMYEWGGESKYGVCEWNV